MHWQFPLHQQENNEKIFSVPAIFNRMPGLCVATNKRRLAQIFKRMNSLYESEFNFTPKTFVMPNEALQLKNAMANSPKKTWIIKPSGGSEGCGIFLAMKFKDIPAYALQ